MRKTGQWRGEVAMLFNPSGPGFDSRMATALSPPLVKGTGFDFNYMCNRQKDAYCLVGGRFYLCNVVIQQNYKELNL